MKKIITYAVITAMLCMTLPKHLFVTASTTSDYWVIHPVTTESLIDTSTEGLITLSNGLVERTINISEQIGGVTTSFRNLYKDWELLDHTEKEGILTLDGTSYSIGGTTGQRFTYSYYTEELIEKEFNWSPKPYITHANPWPALGKQVVLVYTPSSDMPTGYQNLTVEVKYEIYQGIPVIGKRITMKNNGTQSVRVNGYTNDVLAVKSELKDKLYVENTYNGGSDLSNR